MTGKKKRERKREKVREKKKKEREEREESQQRTAEAGGTWSELSLREGVAARYWRVVRGAHGPHAARISIPTDPARRGADIQGRLINDELSLDRLPRKGWLIVRVLRIIKRPVRTRINT